MKEVMAGKTANVTAKPYATEKLYKAFFLITASISGLSFGEITVWPFPTKASRSSSGEITSVIFSNGTTIVRYSVVLINRECIKMENTVNAVDTPKNIKAAFVAALEFGLSTSLVDTPAAEEKNWTKLTRTPTAACPEMSGCIAGGPRSETIAIREHCIYDPAAAWAIPFIMTKKKKSVGGRTTNVVNASNKLRIAIAYRVNRIT